MFKSLLISLNLVGLALIPMLYVGEVNVNVDAPSTMNAGEDVEVTLTLNKGTATGPARIKLNFDEAAGLSAEEIENSGASFSFNDGVGLYIWYSIPAEETLTLKFRLRADAAALGTKNITGTFSYLDGEERKKVTIPTITINVESGEMIASNNTNENNTNTENNNNSTETTNTTEPQTNSIGDISCTRNIEELGTEAIVTLTIQKGSNGGFARIKENVPNGFTAEKIEADGSVFKFSDNIVKFLWSSVNPSQEELVVKYKLTPSEGMTGSYSVDGSFTGEFLIVNDEPQTIEIQSSTFNITGEALASNETNSNNGSENNNTTNSNNTSNNTTESNENNNNTASNNSNTNSNETNETSNSTSIETTNNNTGSNGVNYKVQILAAHKTVSNSYIKKRYGYSGSVDLENHQGWTKYTTGQFNTYRDARDKRESLSSYNFPGPFVTAYNNGARITVQEALMLTNQKWVQ